MAFNIRVGESEGEHEQPFRVSWEEQFSDLSIIDHYIDHFALLNDLEIDYSGVIEILNKYRVALDQNSDFSLYEYAIQLIRGFEGLKVIEQDAETFLGDEWEESMSLGDDMPNLTVHVIVEISPDAVVRFQSLISELSEEFERLELQYHGEFSDQAEAQRIASEKREEEKRARENALRRGLDRDEKAEKRQWIKRHREAIEEFMKGGQGLKVIGPYLLDSQSHEIFVITINLFYRKTRDKNEEFLTKRLKSDYRVYEITETYPEGSSHIPIFAAQRRLIFMGWEQNTSIFTADDDLLVKRAEKLRFQYLESR